MSDTVLERHFRDRMQSVQRLASLPETQRAGLTWRDYQDLVALYVELSASGRNLIEEEYRRCFTHPGLTVGWLTERRRVIEELGDGYAQLAATVRACADQARQAAGAPNGTDADLGTALDEAVKALTETKQKILKQWLIGSPEEMAEARAAIARGETEDIEEVFAEIAGMDVATWRKSVEEHKLEQRSAEG